MTIAQRNQTIDRTFGLRKAELDCQAAASIAQRLAYTVCEYGKARACGDLARATELKEQGKRLIAQRDYIEYSQFAAEHQEYRNEVVITE